MDIQAYPETTKRVTTASYFLLFAGIGISSSLMGPSLLSFTQQTNSTLQQLGLLFIIGPTGYLIGTWVSGHLYDHMQGHKLLVIALLVMATVAFFIPLGSTLFILAFLAMISGICVGVAETGGNTLLVWLRGEQAGAYLNGLHFFYGVGAFLGPIIVAGTIRLGVEIPKTYWFSALVIALIAGFIFFLPSPAFRSIVSPPALQQIRMRILSYFGILLFIAAGVEACLGGWLFTYLVSVKSTSEITASAINSAFWGSLTLSRLLIIPFTHRVKAKIILLGCILLCMVSLAMLIPDPLIFTWSGFIGLGLSIGPLYPTLISLTQDFGISSGKSIGWLLAAGGAGAMSLPWVVSHFFQTSKPNILLIVNGICFIIALIVLLNIHRFYDTEPT
jgi:FHS family Na+ dependent glucose MFS transporter 1